MLLFLMSFCSVIPLKCHSMQIVQESVTKCHASITLVPVGIPFLMKHTSKIMIVLPMHNDEQILLGNLSNCTNLFYPPYIEFMLVSKVLLLRLLLCVV